MALNTRIIRPNKIQFRRVHYIRPSRVAGMFAARTVATLRSHVPFHDGFCFDVVVDGMTTITQRASRPFHIVRWIERYPPVGVRLYEICTPDFVIDVPLSTKREVIIADLLEVSLLPFAAVH